MTSAGGYEKSTERAEPLTPGAYEKDDPRFSTLPTNTLKRLLWAAKGCRCTCIQSAGTSYEASGTAIAWLGKRFDCPRCTAIRDVCEAVPDVL